MQPTWTCCYPGQNLPKHLVTESVWWCENGGRRSVDLENCREQSVWTIIWEFHNIRYRLMCEINISDLSNRKLIFRDGLVVPSFFSQPNAWCSWFSLVSLHHSGCFGGVTIYLKCFMKMVNNFPKVDEPVGPDHPNSLLTCPSNPSRWEAWTQLPLPHVALAKYHLKRSMYCTIEWK